MWAKKYGNEYTTVLCSVHFSSETDVYKLTRRVLLLVEAKTLFDPSLETGHRGDSGVTQLIVMALMRPVWI